MKSKIGGLLIVLSAFLAISSVVSAQIPVRMVLSAAWSTPTVLTSRLNTPSSANLASFPNQDGVVGYLPMAGDDEVNYTDLSFSLLSNVSFWTMQITCTQTPNTALSFYTFDAFGLSTANPGDNIAPYVQGTIWGIDSISPIVQPNNTTGGFSVTMSRQNNPGAVMIGENGVERTYGMGTMRLRVRPQLNAPTNNANSTTYNQSITVACTANLLDRLGRSLGTVTSLPITPLRVIAGYSIRGQVQYQGLTSHLGIQVTCEESATSILLGDTETNTMGDWVLNGVRVINPGAIDCLYWSNRSNPTEFNNTNDAYLAQVSYGTLRYGDFQFLPVRLVTGNVDAKPPVNSTVDSLDIAAVTAAFDSPVGTSYRAGDTNGDGLVNRVDLALVTNNLGLSAPAFWGMYGAHFILSAQMTPTNILQDSRISINLEPSNRSNVAFGQFVPGTNRDFWATLSPNGQQLAFVRAIGTGAALRYVLHIAPITNGMVGTPVRVTPATGWNYDDLAPSWSPNGTMLAFICSAVPTSGARPHENNRGNLCVVDTTGRNLRALSNIVTKVSAPAWRNDTQIFFDAPSASGGLCDNTICLSSLYGNVNFIANLPAGAMHPVYNVNTKSLYYFDFNANSLKFANDTGTTTPAFNPVNEAPTAVTCSNSNYHLTVMPAFVYAFAVDDNGYSVIADTGGWNRFNINNYCEDQVTPVVPQWTVASQSFTGLVPSVGTYTAPWFAAHNTIDWAP
jgi:hypothetical protein